MSISPLMYLFMECCMKMEHKYTIDRVLVAVKEATAPGVANRLNKNQMCLSRLLPCWCHRHESTSSTTSSALHVISLRHGDAIQHKLVVRTRRLNRLHSRLGRERHCWDWVYPILQLWLLPPHACSFWCHLHWLVAWGWRVAVTGLRWEGHSSGFVYVFAFGWRFHVRHVMIIRVRVGSGGLWGFLLHVLWLLVIIMSRGGGGCVGMRYRW